MKVGILTQPLSNNYGGLLQNYALQQVLKGMGHEVSTIKWETPKVSPLHRYLWRIKLFLLSVMGSKEYSLTKKERDIILQHTHRFVRNNISICNRVARSIDDFKEIAQQEHFDAIVVGSDQVWRPRYNSFIGSMFLDFLGNSKVLRVAYAASFGTDCWEFTPEMTTRCRELAQKFNMITVREKSGVELCRDYLGVEAKQVLDPTMLLNREDYQDMVFSEKDSISTGTLFHYILDPTEEKRQLIERVAKSQGMTPFTIMPKYQNENRTRHNVKSHIEDCVYPSVTSWLRGFMDAEMVIVDSFHGAVFSIIFNKPFWVIANEERGNARFDSLLSLFELEDRMVTYCEEIDWNKPIDWEMVNEKRKSEQIRCKDLLITELSKKKY